MCWNSSSFTLIHLTRIYCGESEYNQTRADTQPVRETVNDRGLFTAGWFGMREKHCSRLEIYDRLRANEHADG